MKTVPKMSFIVLSYNYDRYISQTIQSILGQTVQDFEIVVVDDNSRDRSISVIESFGDSRIRLIKNDSNLGGAASYNIAVGSAKGEWLVNLDADDWIEPRKSEVQLKALREDPRIDVIGTHCKVWDDRGSPYCFPDGLVPPAFSPLSDLNDLELWIGNNPLCRSSTMVRREAHLRIGFDDDSMIRAPDFELWTRALRMGSRFEMVPEALTNYRIHSGGVTFADLRGSFLELCYSMIMNLLPVFNERAMWPSHSKVVSWICESELASRLSPIERYNLIGAIFSEPRAVNYETFIADLQIAGPATLAGKRIFASWRASPLKQRVEELEVALASTEDGKAWWIKQAENWEAAFASANVARSWWAGQSELWEGYHKSASGGRGTARNRVIAACLRHGRRAYRNVLGRLGG